MAADVVQFLRNRFSRSLVEAKSELSGSGPANLLSFLGAIEQAVTQKQINPTADFTALIRTLTKLNDALSECRTFLANHVGKELNWAVMTNCYLKKRMTALEREFAALVENPYTPEAAPERKEEEVVERWRWRFALWIGGFFNESKSIWNALSSKSAAEDIGLTVIGIVGMAGTGKTSLVNSLFGYHLNKSIGVKDAFSPIIHVCLSDVIKDKQAGIGNGMEEETRIVKHILEKLELISKVDQEETSGITGAGLESLLQRLHKHLLGKRYLIVLDDVWDIKPFYLDLAGTTMEQTEEHDDQCPRLTQGLPKGKGSSRGAVIFTTRIPEVVHHMASKDDTIIELRSMDKLQSIWLARATLHRWNRERSVVRAYGDIMDEITHRCQGLPLAAKIFGDTIPFKIFESTRVLKELYLPDRFSYFNEDQVPECPVLVLIDVKEELGVSLFDEFRYRLGSDQVRAVLEDRSASVPKLAEAENPKSALIHFYSIFENLRREISDLKLTQNTLPKKKKKKTDPQNRRIIESITNFHNQVQKGMRIIIVGGDAVANKIFRTLSDLELPESPAFVVIAPHGTENNFAFSFGWEELKVDGQSMRSFLEQVTKAEPMKIDSWHILIEMKNAQSLTAYQHRQTSLLPLPHVDEREEPKVDNSTLCGGFWNYFSLDVNALSCKGPSCFHPTPRISSSFAKVQVLKHPGGQWEDFNIPTSIRSILCLNLPCYHGGLNPWQIGDSEKDQKRGLTPSFIDDARLEIIGSKDDFLSQTKRKKWIHLDQVRGIRFEFTEGTAEAMSMRIDGAPWKNIPLDVITSIEIYYHGKLNILAHPNRDCPAKSIHESSQPRVSETDVNNHIAKDGSSGGHKELLGVASTDSKLPIDDNKAKVHSESQKTFGNVASSSKIPSHDGNAEDYHEWRHKKFGAGSASEFKKAVYG